MNSFWKSLLFTIGGTISLVSSLAASGSVVPVTAKCDTRLNVNWHQAILSAPVMRIITQHATNYFVPIADMARELDHACDIVGAKATIAGRGFKAEIKAGDSTAIINGKRLDLSAPAQVFAGVLAISADDIGPVFRVRAGYVAATDCINVSTFRLEGKVADYKGRNVFWVNGTPMPPLMYSGTEHSRKTWSGRPRQSLEEFTAQGYRIIQTDLWFKYSLRSDGTFDLAGIRDQLAGILEVNPKAQLVVRINVSAPPWWLQQNSDEVCQVTAAKMEKNTFGGNTAESLASSKYREFTEKYLRLFLQELEQTPEADRIIGFHIGGGVYGEWHYYGIYHEPDASEPMRQRFIRFARAHYNTIEQLNAAWKTTFATFADIHVPSFERRYQTGDGDFRDPQQDLYVIQYYQCQQAVVAELVNGLAKLTKETWSRPTIVGLFYGYFYGGWTVGAQASQFDIKTLFSSPYVDYFSGPYASRNMRGSGYFRTLVDSVSLHGKVWVSEHDGGTHLGNISNSMFPDIPADEAQSLARMRRNYMYTLTDNAGQWWYDFGPKNLSGWWSTPRLLTETRRLRELSEELFAQPYEKKSEVLVVYDMEAFNYVRPARVDRLTVKMTENLSDALLGTGVPFDRIFLMDLPRLDLTKYKVIIFANTLALDSKQRDYIKRRVMKAGRSVVFMSGAGYTDGVTNDVAHISELTGMQIEKTGVAASTLTVTLSGGDFTLDATGITSRFKIADAGAQIIGNYDTKEPGAAVKDMAGCKIYYFGIPLKAEVGFFTTLLTKSNVRTYVANTTNGDYVAIGGGIIAIYSVNGGEKVIHPLRAPARTVSMPPYSTRYFDISNGADKI